jgi:predicted N-acetyltransferase YhbS
MEDTAQLDLVDKDELPAIATLINEAFASRRWELDPVIFRGTRTSAAKLAKEMEAQPRATFLQCKNKAGSRVGCVLLSPTNESSSEWYLGYLCLDIGQQSAGMGVKLLAMAEGWAKQRGAKVIQLKVVDVRVPLIDWYIRRGYSKIGSEPFPYGNFEADTMLFEGLQLVVLQKDIL